MEAWGPDDHGTIKNLELYKGYKAKYEELLGKGSSKIVKPIKKKVAIPLKSMTKDELNDIAAREFPDIEIKGHWSKKKIISELEKQF